MTEAVSVAHRDCRASPLRCVLDCVASLYWSAMGRNDRMGRLSNREDVARNEAEWVQPSVPRFQ